MSENDGRKVKGWLPQLTFSKPNPVVQVINDKTKEVLYTVRIKGKKFQPKVYTTDPHSIRLGKNQPINLFLEKEKPVSERLNAKKLDLDPYL
jgi:hypothetical protein